LSRLPMQPHARVLDIGCGTGELLSRLAASYPDAQLAGVDPARDMLNAAEAKLAGRADLQVAYADSLPWPDGSFDAVISCNVFHYITHPMVALHEIKRVLRPLGNLVITDWCDDFLTCRVCSMYLRVTNRTYHRTYRQHECLNLLRGAGYANIEIDRYKINWLWGLMTAVATRT
jgi:ubiquinone/menaquinone biosynthesis C-methylase UbiE